ncbi:MAG TPA: CHAP domain-containing protein [Kofleriaceae bacterium]|nr:CHAP domain-containing protein [Kofleriaceae bacterium]
MRQLCEEARARELLYCWARRLLVVAVMLSSTSVRAGPSGQAATEPEPSVSEEDDDDQAAAPGDDIPLPASVEAVLEALKKAPSEQVRLNLELTLTPVAAEKKPVAPSQQPSRAEIEASEAPKPGKPGKPGKSHPAGGKLYTKVVKDATRQVGYHETAGNCTRYGEWYGHGMRCVDWCDIFVSWVYGEAGQLDAIGGKHSFVPAHYDWFRKHKRFHARGTKPCRGCIVFFDLNHNRELDHIGIVTSYTASHIFTVEGNRTNQVKRVKYARSDRDIFGYGYPEWRRGSPRA